ncbi:MAG: spore coat protein CotJB [Bacillota bacterium]|nr:spore coat protein CotJB [Bacillota bacterium]
MNGQGDNDVERLQAIQFSILDLNLYLDTHPADKKAMMDFDALMKQFEMEKRNFESKYGPLANYGYSPSQYPWQWINAPWPWEMR